MYAQVSVFPVGAVRRGGRRTVNFVASVRDNLAVTRTMRVTDISATGCKLEGAGALAAGSEVWIKPEGHFPVKAQIKWAEADDAGCAFLSELTAEEVEGLTAPTTVVKKGAFRR
jgi:PilZ domain